LDGSPENPLEFIQVQIANVESKFATIIFDRKPHLTKVDSFGVDLSMEGSLILCSQVDQSGMIGSVGNILGEENINVSFMSVGKITPQKQAVMTIGVDEKRSKEALNRIGEIPAVEEFVFLKL